MSMRVNGSAAPDIRRAGVSIGSLYQYFPDKKAIAYALVEATSSHAARALREEIYTDVNLPHLEAAHRAIGLVLRIYQKHELVLLRLASEEPELRQWVVDLSLERLISSAARHSRVRPGAGNGRRATSNSKGS